MEKMREESASKHSRGLVYILTKRSTETLKRAVDVPRRESINYGAMDVQCDFDNTVRNSR